jgi:hypothetical protein
MFQVAKVTGMAGERLMPADASGVKRLADQRLALAPERKALSRVRAVGRRHLKGTGEQSKKECRRDRAQTIARRQP